MRRDSTGARRWLPAVGSVVVLVWAWAHLAMTPHHVSWLWQVAAAVAAGSLALYPVAAVATAAHEACHVLVGLAFGWRVSSCRIGYLLVEPSAARRVRWIRQGGFRGYTNLDAEVVGLRRRYPLIALAGPAGGLLVAAALAAVGAALAGPARWCAFTIAALVVIAEAANLAPVVRASGPYDGGWVWLFWRRPQEAVTRLAVSRLLRLAEQGVRPRDWPHDWVTAATTHRGGGEPSVHGHRFAALACIDRHDLPTASQLLGYALAHRTHLPEEIRPTILADVPYYLARHAGMTDKAAAVLAQTRGASGINGFPRLQAMAAVALGQGRYADALAACDAWARARARLPDVRPGLTAMYAEWIAAMRTEAEQALAGRPVAGPEG